MAEREQGITIDVAYRYFTTDHRSFIVADTPGHEEYTRNMAVGASFAQLAVILVDAKQGVLVQTRRHARICSFMGIRYFVFAVNKMDLIGYDRERFEAIERQIQELAEELSLPSVKIIPVSATEGDNVTTHSENIPWYTGEPLLTYLEQVDVSEQTQEKGFYLPVQRVCRPNHTFRGFQGQVESGEISVGEELVTLPSGERAVVKSILVGDKESSTAVKGQPVTIQLDREVDVSRGCVLERDASLQLGNLVTVKLLWMDDSELTEGKQYFVKLGTKQIPGVITKIAYKIDVNTGEHKAADVLVKNEIAVCEVAFTEKIVLDRFETHKTLGELIFIDRITNMTSACAVVEEVKDTGDEGEERSSFVSGDRKARGDIFEEFYYNMESASVTGYHPAGKTYTVGDEIPTQSESYHYPDNFDILVLRDKTAVKIRDKKVAELVPFREYHYSGVPVVNGRGFAIHGSSEEELQEFLAAWQEAEGTQKESAFFNRWVSFETYRNIVFHNNFWVI